MNGQPEIRHVDPARIAVGHWCHERQAMIGEGDISASYSADLIAMDSRVRKPFRWNGALYVATGTCGPADEIAHDAYRLQPANSFPGAWTTYAEKTRDAAAARDDPNGFYHGIAVRQAGTNYVLSGPPIRFIAGPESEPTLFGRQHTERQR